MKVQHSLQHLELFTFGHLYNVNLTTINLTVVNRYSICASLFSSWLKCGEGKTKKRPGFQMR